MRAIAAIVADDLTGAADAGIGLRRSGLAVSVTWAAPDLDRQVFERADVVAVDAGTRAMEPEDAVAATSRLVSSMRTAGVPALYKKIDSTLRGHIGAELRATLAGWQPRPIAIVAPAFPGMRRTTVDGRQRVEGTPLAQPAIPAVLEKAGVRTALVDLAKVRRGPLSESFSEFREQGIGAVVCDAETDEDLLAIAHGGARLGAGVVWVGSGGLSAVLGQALGLAPARGDATPVPNIDGPKLIVVGSASSVARAQAAHLAGSRIERLDIPAAALLGTASPAGVLFEHAIPDRLARGGDLLVTIGDEPAPGAADDPRLLDRLAEWLRPCAGLVGGLIVTGGETATRVLRAWHTSALELVEEIEPGVPLSVSVGPRPIAVVTKAGSFGEPQTLTRSLTKLRSWIKAQARARELGRRA